MIFKNVYVDTVIMLDRACGTDAFMYLNTLTTQQDKHRYKVINPIKMQHMCVCVSVNQSGNQYPKDSYLINELNVLICKLLFLNNFHWVHHDLALVCVYVYERLCILGRVLFGFTGQLGE